MYYLLFALFFAGYLVIGFTTDAIDLSTMAVVLSTAFICGNLYMFFKSKKEEKEDTD
ncbi:hypothetical protein [Halobacillus yeomjeoni]|uniref:Uncharacterized protein n=1 Tax=Halobacillus yeomjeoni TaxID=311194 RepID=A0A931HWG0_9BACI|nr:hypothetical protein [Halobacillus yeomjeoni]MBH0230678.1 hypothetical protein [Halobacillus yeomjeoni]